MKTIKKVHITPVLVEYIPSIEDMDDNTIYISVPYKTASHKCLCGRGELTVTPLNPKDWHADLENGKLTLSPSIGNFQYPCKSHYIIRNNVANFV